MGDPRDPRLEVASIIPLALALAVAGATSGCSGGTEPSSSGGPASVQISVASLGAPVYSVGSGGIAVITCDVGLRAKVRGPGSVTWLGATFRWYPGTTGTTPFDSAVVSAGNIQSTWGGVITPAGDTATAAWYFSATIPFNAELEYRYRPTGSNTVAASTVRFACSPVIPKNPAAASISSITLNPASSQIQAGDTVDLGFTATAGAGLWQTLLHVGGACDSTILFADTALVTVTHITRFVVPPGCAINSPLSIGVAVLDARLAQTSSVSPLAPMLVDHRPPTLTATGILLPMRQPSLTLAGNLFVGDRLELLVDAIDAQALAAVYWEIPSRAYLDSQVVSGSQVSARSSIALAPTWTGPLDVRLYARDAAGLLSSAVTSSPGALQVYPQVVAPSVTRAFSMETRDVRISARRGQAYLLHGNQLQVEAVDLVTGATTGVIPLPTIPDDFDLTPSEDSLLLAFTTMSAIAVVDLTNAHPSVSLIPVTILDSAAGGQMVALRALANGKAFVTLTGLVPSESRLLEVDLATGLGVTRADAGSGGFVQGPMERSDDGRAVVVGVGPDHFQRYDVAGDVFGPVRPRPVTDAKLRVDGTLQHASIGLLTFDGGLVPAGQATSTFGGLFGASALSADGSTLYYVDAAHGLVRTRTLDGSLVSATPIKHLTSYLRRSADDAWMITVESLDGTSSLISILDLR